MYSRITERIFTIVSLLFYTGGPLQVTVLGNLPDSTLIKFCFQLIYVITLSYLVPHWRKAAYLLIKDKFIFLLMLLIFFSTLWSIDIEQTFTRFIAVFGTTLFGLYFATRYSLKQQLHLLGWVFGLAIIMSILFVIALPQYGIMQEHHPGTWRGIYTHKNGLGAVMALSAITFLILFSDASNIRNKWILRIGVSASIALLLLSKSSSPLIYLLILTLVFFISQFLRWGYRSKVVAISLSTTFGYILAICGFFQAEAVANALGKDLTFTGRTELWAAVWELIQKKPWLGYGYGALWSSWNSETVAVWRRVGFESPNAHNGFLELWLDLGIVGIVVLTIHMTTSAMRVFGSIAQTKSATYFLPLMLILFIVMSNITESNLIDRNSIFWVLYVSTSLSLQHKLNINENDENTLLSSSPDSGGERSVSTYKVT